MTARTLAEVLSQDVLNTTGPMPELGMAARPVVLLDYLAAERSAVADALVNVEALCGHILALLKAQKDGRLSGDLLAAEVNLALTAIRQELAYDEKKMLSLQLAV